MAEQVIKVVVDRLRPYFTPDESRKLAMNVKRLPQPDILKYALINFDKGKVTKDQIRILVENWPKTPVIDLDKEVLGENEKWDTAEAFMKNLTQP